MLSCYLIVISSLLICLSNPQKSVRQNALPCLLLLNEAATSSDPKTLSDSYISSPLLYLLDAIATSKLELIADQMGIRLLLECLFLSKEDRDGVFQFKKDFSAETLGSSSRRKSRRKAESRARSAILESILDSLMTVTVSIETPPSYIICQLLSVLSGVDHEVSNNSTHPQPLWNTPTLLTTHLDCRSAHAQMLSGCM